MYSSLTKDWWVWKAAYLSVSLYLDQHVIHDPRNTRLPLGSVLLYSNFCTFSSWDILRSLTCSNGLHSQYSLALLNSLGTERVRAHGRKAESRENVDEASSLWMGCSIVSLHIVDFFLKVFLNVIGWLVLINILVSMTFPDCSNTYHNFSVCLLTPEHL